MQKPQIIQKDYSIFNSSYQLVMPLNLEMVIAADDSVRLLSEVLEELDYTKLLQAYSQIGRAPASPRKMFKIMIYAYMNGIYSSRAIERACRRDINFMWLLNGMSAPDHNTINRFRSERLKDVLDNLFYQFVSLLGTLDEISYENLFVDGTKIEANANKYSFVWKKSTEKHETRLIENIEKLIKEVEEEHEIHVEGKIDKSPKEKLQEILEYLEALKHSQDIIFVSGIGKRKTPLQRHFEKAKEYLEKQEKYDGYKEILGNRNSFSKTDHDATFMHMKEDHMRNAQLKPGYNIQIGVEGGYVVGTDIFSERSDQLTFIPFLDMLAAKLPERHKRVVADAGYESEENYLHLEATQQVPFIKPQPYEMMKSRSFKNRIEKRENMVYDSILDEFICHNNRRLKYMYDSKRKSQSGYETKVRVYECENCKDCQYKPRCTKAQGNKKISFSPTFAAKRQQSLDNITSPLGIVLRMNRSIQVEGVFGVLKEDYGFRRFLTRGKQSVKTEFMLLCFGYNVNKLHRNIQTQNAGTTLFKSSIA